MPDPTHQPAQATMSRKGSLSNIAVNTPVALALLIPAGAFGVIPLLNLPLAAILLLIMAGGTLAVWRQFRLLRPPFEYWWAGVAFLLTMPAALFLDDDPQLTQSGAGLLAFFAALTLAANGTTACRALVTFGFATGVGAVLHWMAASAWIMPTVVHVSTGTFMAGPNSFSAGNGILLIGFAVNAAAILHPGFTATQRLLAVSGLVAILSWFGYLFSQSDSLLATWTPPPLHRLDILSLLPALVALWIAARVSARALFLAKMRSEVGRVAFPVATGLVAIACLATGTIPVLAAAFILGLVAALDTPWTRYESTPTPWAGWFVPAFCVVAQLAGLFPVSDGDPRNQAAREERLLATGQLREGVEENTLLLMHRPEHPDLTLLRARLLLALDRPLAAVEAYCAAQREETPFVQRNQRSFLDDLRDYASAQSPGEVQFIFERALIHDGEFEQAKSLLKIRQSRAMSPAEPRSHSEDTMKRALATLLGTTPNSLPLNDWDGSALEATLLDAGVNLRGLPSDRNPLLLSARRDPEGTFVYVVDIDTGATREFHDLMPGMEKEIAPHDRATWKVWSQDSEGTWHIDLAAGDALIGTLHCGAEIAMDFKPQGTPCAVETGTVALFLP
jgi:hypothetical protein